MSNRPVAVLFYNLEEFDREHVSFAPASFAWMHRKTEKNLYDFPLATARSSSASGEAATSVER
jgi:hypothetical protein